MSKKRKNSKAKGASGEREAANWLKERGAAARRGVQYQGGPDSPDLVHDIPNVHIEVKRTERLRVYEFMEQAKSEAPAGSTPVVLHRQNGQKWVVILDAEDWLRLVRPVPPPVLVDLPEPLGGPVGGGE